VITTKRCSLLLHTTAFFVVLFLVKKLQLKDSIEKLIHKINEIKTHSSKKTSLGICRYLVFSHITFWLLMLICHTLIATISSVYFLASSLPTFQFWTFVKGVLLFISSGF
jgi:hypothetical protein